MVTPGFERGQRCAFVVVTAECSDRNCQRRTGLESITLPHAEIGSQGRQHEVLQLRVVDDSQRRAAEPVDRLDERGISQSM
jgi:hypothetical protein